MPTWIRAHRPLPAHVLHFLLVMATALTALTASAHASAQAPAAASWQWDPVDAPAPPTGTPPGPFAVPLGPVGQISFWAPNRGLLITGGTEGQNNVTSGGVVGAGVWAYNGAQWHELSDVCGGGNGRIAWAGPDEFWTVADQRPGEYEGSIPPYLTSLSLCHFYDGQVIASYALPTSATNPYEPMDAAACDGPDDCWFGGEDTTGPDPGAFELHWDGTNLTQTQEPDDDAVDDSTIYQGQIYESVRLVAQGTPPAAPASGTAVFHEIEGDSFDDVFSYSESQKLLLPWYGYAPGVQPNGIQGFALSTDAGTAQEGLLGGSTSSCVASNGCPQLWAAADPATNLSTGTTGDLTILRHTGAGWTQITPDPDPAQTATSTTCPTPADPLTGLSIGQLAQCLPDSDSLYGATANLGGGNVAGQPGAPTSWGTSDGAIAAMPGTDEAWVSLASGGGTPQAALIDANGVVQQFDAPTDPENTAVSPAPANGVAGAQYDQAFTEAGQDGTAAPGPGGLVGAAGAVDCPMDNDCWMATANGWLYHYTDGTQLPVDTDPNFAQIITVRPPDAATETVYGDVPPIDDSGTNDSPTTNAPTGTAKVVKSKASSIVVRLTKLKAKLVHGHDLQLSFDLNVRARIQIIAERHGTVVARSARKVLGRGRHTLTLTLNRRRWPNHLKVDAKAVTGATSKMTKKK